MCDNCPADNNTDLANTVKETTTCLTTVESQLKAQSEDILTLRAEREGHKAGKVNQDKELSEVRGTCAELNDRCGVLKDKYNAIKADNDQLKSRVDELEANQPPPSPYPPKAPSTLTNIPNPTATTSTPASTLTCSTSPPPTSLALPWRCAFLLVGSAAPGFYINHALTGNSWFRVMGGASSTTSGGGILLYYFASLDRYDHDE